MKFDKIAETIVVEDKNSIMYERLNEFYQNDTLVMAEYPNEKINWRFKPFIPRNVICLEGISPILKEQIKAYMRNELIRFEKDYGTILHHCVWPIHNVIPYLERVQIEDILLCTDKDLYADYIEFFRFHYWHQKSTREELNVLRKIKRFTKALQQKQQEA